MSLYNMMHGMNPAAPLLLAILDLTPSMVPRFRDCMVTSDDEILIHTRTGGGNRDYYESLESCKENYPDYFNGTDEDPSGPWNDDLVANPNYLRDEDSEFDCTYANFYFKIPDAYREEVLELYQQDDLKPEQKWKILLAALKTKDLNDPIVKSSMEKMSPILNQIRDALEGKQ